MRTYREIFRRLGTGIVLFFVFGLCVSTYARGKVRELAQPVVMEKSTVRGKVVVLESRRQKRRTLQNLRVQVWSLEQEEQDTALVHETRTDEGGMFDLPILDEGDYRLLIGQLSMRLRVIAQAAERDGLAEPKILLIMLPQEVVGDRI